MTIWFSGKEMQRGKVLADFVGKNEKTKVIVKVQKVWEKNTMKTNMNLFSYRKVMLHPHENVSYPKTNRTKWWHIIIEHNKK